MFKLILKQIKDKIRNNQYVMTIHAEEEMDEDGLTIFDVENGILKGKVVERQKDSNTGEWKYLINGPTLNGIEIIVVVKFSLTGKLVIITVYIA